MGSIGQGHWWSVNSYNIGRSETHHKPKSRDILFVVSVVQSFCNFVYSTAVTLPCYIQNFKNDCTVKQGEMDWRDFARLKLMIKYRTGLPYCDDLWCQAKVEPWMSACNEPWRHVIKVWKVSWIESFWVVVWNTKLLFESGIIEFWLAL